MNNFRTQTFNITESGKTESFLLQGGLRWQSIKLLTDNTITLKRVGIRPSVAVKDVDTLPGSFHTSNSDYHTVWGLGARAAQAACVDAHTQPSTWELTDDGVLIRGQFSAESAKGYQEGNYTMSFSTRIAQSATGWKVATGLNGGYGAYFIVTSKGPSFVNTDTTLVPKNKLIAGYGLTIVNQTILPSGPVRYYDLPMTIEDGEWYRIKTIINATGYDVSINGQRVAFVTSGSDTPTARGTDKVTDGSWGFGPFVDQAAYYKDVEVVAQNGSKIYDNPMTSEQTLHEYGVAENERAVCLDGAKRDRNIWIGDFAHTGRIIAASTGRYDYWRSMIEVEFDWQYTHGPAKGLVPINAGMGQDAEYRQTSNPVATGETDYQIYCLLAVGDYFSYTNDIDLIRKYWGGIRTLVRTFVNRLLDPQTGLLVTHVPGGGWFTAQGSQNATAPTALLVVALNQLVPIAERFDDQVTAQHYTALSKKISNTINEKLWEPELGAYAVSLQNPTWTSLLAAAYTIRGGIANDTQAEDSIKKLSTLFYEIGYKDSTNIEDSPDTSLSPFTQGFLFDALFLAHLHNNVPAKTILPLIKTMLDHYWPKMFNQPEYASGASWEYVAADGKPGISLFTSLSHPWGGAPTYILSNYILGVRREQNRHSDDFEWVFDPAWDVIEGLGLKWAKGSVPLPDGGLIEAEWQYESGSAEHARKPNMNMNVRDSRNTRVNVKKPQSPPW